MPSIGDAVDCEQCNGQGYVNGATAFGTLQSFGMIPPPTTKKFIPILCPSCDGTRTVAIQQPVKKVI